jgi:TatD DNase family protein
MNLPSPGDYIDIHNHGGRPSPGHYSIENLMAHEEMIPDMTRGVSYTYGIHPWHLTEETIGEQLDRVISYAGHENVIAIGEAGFDRLKGPETGLQQRAFEEQVVISEKCSKPMFIHCVRGWDDLLAVHKKMRPSQPWIIHGFRGKKELALQLVSKGMYISFWFDFVLSPHSSSLVKSLPAERIFLETDGSGEDISTIYWKISEDLGISVGDLKKQIHSNFKDLFLKRE